MKHAGIGGRKKLSNEIKQFSTLAKIMRGEHVEVKKRKKREVEIKKRKMGEKELERKIIISLKMKGCEVAKSGEQSTYNSNFVLNGMSDLIVFIPSGGVVFMEVKQEIHRTHKNGGLRDSQVRFKSLCEKCGIRFEVVYSVEEARKVVSLERIRSISRTTRTKPSKTVCRYVRRNNNTSPRREKRNFI